MKAKAPRATAVHGKNATLSCTGKYVPKGYTFIFWMFKEQEISENKKYSITTAFYTERNAFVAKMMVNTSLTIRNIDWADEGNYACVASSHFGSDKQQLQLMVSNGKSKKFFICLCIGSFGNIEGVMKKERPSYVITKAP